jgi:hypothetical protein
MRSDTVLSANAVPLESASANDSPSAAVPLLRIIAIVLFPANVRDLATLILFTWSSFEDFAKKSRQIQIETPATFCRRF